jgi:hypothetical protein
VIPELQRCWHWPGPAVRGRARDARLTTPAKLTAFAQTHNTSAIQAQNAQISSPIGELPNIAGQGHFAATVVVNGQLSTVECS